jgi:hypothetical protein
MVTNWNERLTGKLQACLERAEKTHKMAKKTIEALRQLLRSHEMPIYMKEQYRKQLCALRQIVKATQSEIATLRALNQRLRDSELEPYKTIQNPRPETPWPEEQTLKD